MDRYLAPDPLRLGGGIALPFAIAMAEYDLRPQELALEVAAGNVDLGLEAELLAEPDRRAVAVANAVALARSALERVDANRVARRELLELLGDAPRPWIGVSLGVAGDRGRARRGRTGDRCRRGPGPGRGAAQPRARGAPGQGGARRRRAGGPPLRPAAGSTPTSPHGPPIPTGAQRALAVLRRFVDEAGARRRGYVRLMTDAQPLAAPDQAVVAAFERIDIVVGGPDARDRSAGRVDPDRALADHVFAHRLLCRAGARVLVPAGPLLVAPDLERGVPSDPATRAGRALALQLLAVALAQRDGIPAGVHRRRRVSRLARGRAGRARAGRRRGRAAPGAPAGSSAGVRGAGRSRTVTRTRGTRWSRRSCPTRATSTSCSGSRPAPRGLASASTRAAATVATALRAGRSAPVLSGAAADHADRAVAAALATLAALEERGWGAVVDQPLGCRRGRPRRRGGRRADRGVRPAVGRACRAA